MKVALLFAVTCPLVTAHGNPKDWPINPKLGVSGFPDCLRLHPELNLPMEEASFDLECAQKRASPGAIKIGCVGDSITAGVHSSGGNHTYPSQLQMMLDAKYGYGAYSVTNLGACGSTMLKNGDSPFWKRPEYNALISAKWDIVIIMLGTNDAKDHGSHGPNNWQHDCGGPNHTTLDGCSFAKDFEAMIDVVRSLGRTDTGPQIYAAIPPPLMQKDAYGMNQTVLNAVYPKLIPLIQKAEGIMGPINVYKGMGGVDDWQSHIPSSGCSLDSSWAPCKWYCDGQSCDQCHPNDNGYKQLASIVMRSLKLPPAPPTPPPAPSPPGAWFYEREGDGKLFVPEDRFKANDHSGRSGSLSDVTPDAPFMPEPLENESSPNQIPNGLALGQQNSTGLIDNVSASTTSWLSHEEQTPSLEQLREDEDASKHLTAAAKLRGSNCDCCGCPSGCWGFCMTDWNSPWGRQTCSGSCQSWR